MVTLLEEWDENASGDNISIVPSADAAEFDTLTAALAVAVSTTTAANTGTAVGTDADKGSAGRNTACLRSCNCVVVPACTILGRSD